MKLVLPFPTDWHIEERNRVLHVRVPRHRADPDLMLTVSPLRPLPVGSGGAWLHHQLNVDIPDGAGLTTEQPTDGKSAHGWPIARLRGSVVDPAGTLIQQRISVVFRILDHYAIVELRAATLDHWDALSDDVRTVIMNAELDWSAPACSLAQLYEFDSDLLDRAC